MKIIHYSIPLIISTLIACSHFQEEERIEQPNTIGYVTVPNETLAQKTTTPLKTLHIGFGVYLRKCGECHTHALPSDLSKEDWHAITPSMSWNANITDKEQAALLKYLLAAKQDPAQPPEQPEIRFLLTPDQS